MSDPNIPPTNPIPPTHTPPPVDYQPNTGGLFAPPPIPGFPPRAEEKTMGMLSHLLALSGVIVPFGNIIGPLVIWLINKDKMPFVDDQGKESLNFQITITIAAVVLGIITICLVGIGGIIVGILGLVFAVVAAIKANNGEYYRYPFSMRIIK